MERTGEAPTREVWEWPKSMETEAGDSVVFFRPEADVWSGSPGASVKLRTAVEVKLSGELEPVYGAVWVTAVVAPGTGESEVVLSDPRVERATFPGAAPDEVVRLELALFSALAKDRPLILARADAARLAGGSAASGLPPAAVNLEPPPIFHSRVPSILIVFLGEPRFEPVVEGGSLEFCLNTNWDLFRDPATGRNFLLVENGWMETQSILAGPWKLAEGLPEGLSNLPEDGNWQEVRQHVPGQRLAFVPEVFVSTEPAELIVTQGMPRLEPLPDLKLSAVVNTDSTVLYHRGEGNYYFLAAGRWFRARQLTGPWSAATFDLPDDFRALPSDGDWTDVLASVPGTTQAEEAALLASTPRMAEISRESARLEVEYDGPAQFEPIQGTALGYGINTPQDVISYETGGQSVYYACHDGVWFTAGSPYGPWVLSDSVPDAIYTIPPTSPVYPVTYVRVYHSTPSTVISGYYPGYWGSYVVGGAVLFGLGYWAGSEWYDWHYYNRYHYSHHYRYRYWNYYHCHRPALYSYGCGARYRHRHGGFVRTAKCYGPYGGAGRVASRWPGGRGYERGYRAYGSRDGANAFTLREGRGGEAGRRGGWGRTYDSLGSAVVSRGARAAGGDRLGREGRVERAALAEAGGADGGRRGQGGSGADRQRVSADRAGEPGRPAAAESLREGRMRTGARPGRGSVEGPERDLRVARGEAPETRNRAAALDRRGGRDEQGPAGAGLDGRRSPDSADRPGRGTQAAPGSSEASGSTRGEAARVARSSRSGERPGIVTGERTTRGRGAPSQRNVARTESQSPAALRSGGSSAVRGRGEATNTNTSRAGVAGRRTETAAAGASGGRSAGVVPRPRIATGERSRPESVASRAGSSVSRPAATSGSGSRSVSPGRSPARAPETVSRTQRAPSSSQTASRSRSSDGSSRSAAVSPGRSSRPATVVPNRGSASPRVRSSYTPPSVPAPSRPSARPASRAPSVSAPRTNRVAPVPSRSARPSPSAQPSAPRSMSPSMPSPNRSSVSGGRSSVSQSAPGRSGGSSAGARSSGGGGSSRGPGSAPGRGARGR
ncbi:MAG TPA: hypothetical protein VMN36_14160 [Verrucomicrobiales bacterium]|nr:hypothetical protein [Verrucomicrobiales bacterium]